MNYFVKQPINLSTMPGMNRGRFCGVTLSEKKILIVLAGDVRTCCIRFLKWVKMRRKFVLCFVSYYERTKEKLRNYFFV